VTDQEEIEYLRAEVHSLRVRLDAATGRSLAHGLARLFGGRSLEDGRVVALLVERAPEPIDPDRLATILWGDRLDGGPSPDSVKVRICRLREKVAALAGGTISSAKKSMGYAIDRATADRLRALVEKAA